MATIDERCPYPNGTVEYFAWWEVKHREAIAEANRRWKTEADRRMYLRSIGFGHDFDWNRRCRLCGMQQIEYYDTPVELRQVCDGRLKNEQEECSGKEEK